MLHPTHIIMHSGSMCSDGCRWLQAQSQPIGMLSDPHGGATTGVDLGRTGHARSDLFLLISNTLAELRVDYSLPGFGDSPTDMDLPPAPGSDQINPTPSLSQPLPQIPEAVEHFQAESQQSPSPSKDAQVEATQLSKTPQTSPAQPSVQLRRPLPLASESVLLQRRSSPIEAPARGVVDERRRRVLPKSPFQTVQGSPP